MPHTGPLPSPRKGSWPPTLQTGALWLSPAQCEGPRPLVRAGEKTTEFSGQANPAHEQQGIWAHPRPAPASQTLGTPQPGDWDAQLCEAVRPPGGSLISEPLRPAWTRMDAAGPRGSPQQGDPGLEESCGAQELGFQPMLRQRACFSRFEKSQLQKPGSQVQKTQVKFNQEGPPHVFRAG